MGARMENNKKLHEETNHLAEIIENQILTEMAEQEGEFNQQEEPTDDDDLNHGPRSAKTRRS